MLFGEIMIPVIETLDKIGVHSNWNPNTNQLIVYDNNIFIKLMQNDFSITVNGKQEQMPLPAFIYKGELYAPAGHILRALEIDSSTNRNALDIKTREIQGEIANFDSIDYRRYTLMQHGIDIYVPENMSFKNDIFTSPFGDAELRILSKSQWQPDTQWEMGTVEGYTKYTDVYLEEASNYYTRADADYVLHFRNFAEKVERQVLANISSETQLPNTRLEHYYEFADFNNLNMRLSVGLHSNMTAENFVDFSGTVRAEGRFVIEVTKDNETYKYYIDIDNYLFGGKIYLPFGVGKHNIAVKLLMPEGGERDILLFSALNTSDFVQRDLVPTAYLDYEDGTVREVLAEIGYRGINQKNTAEVIYRWILQNYSMDKELTGTRKLSGLLAEDTKISPQEACILYAGLLRASGIPSKIAIKRSAKHYWVEAYLNGSWKHMGIVSDLSNQTFLYFYKNLFEPQPEYLEY